MARGHCLSCCVTNIHVLSCWSKCESCANLVIVLSPVLFNILSLCLICKYIICNIILVTKKLALNKMQSEWMCVCWWHLQCAASGDERGNRRDPRLAITIYNYSLHIHLRRPRRKGVAEWNINNSGNVRVAIISRTNANTDTNFNSFL